MKSSIIKVIIKQAVRNVKECIHNERLAARLVNTNDGCCRVEFYDDNRIWTAISHIPIDDLPVEDLEALL